MTPKWKRRAAEAARHVLKNGKSKSVVMQEFLNRPRSKMITVSKLKEKLETLEQAGLGEMEVRINDCRDGQESYPECSAIVSTAKDTTHVSGRVLTFVYD